MNDYNAFPSEMLVLTKERIPSNASELPTIGEIILARLSRREALRGLTAVAALASLAPVGAAVFARDVQAGDAPALDFEEVPHGNTETHAVPAGYRARR